MTTTLNTRIMLKYDSLANWNTRNPVLLKGEIAFVYLTTDVDNLDNTTQKNSGTNKVDPTKGSDGLQNVQNTTEKANGIMYKVGDGTNSFKELPWGSAMAADVYSWAKTANKPTYSYTEVGADKVGAASAAENNAKVYTDSKVGQIEIGAITVDNKAAIALTNGTGTTSTVPIIGENASVSVVNGELKISASGSISAIKIGDQTFEISKGTASLTVSSLQNELGLQSAAYEDSSVFATAAQGSKADSAIQGVQVAGSTVSPNANKIVNITKSNLTTALANTYDAAGAAATAKTEANTYTDTAIGQLGLTATTITGGGANINLTKNGTVKASVPIKGENATVTVENGGIKIKATGTVTSVTEGSTNGTIAVNRTDVNVHGLGTAAYKSEGDFAKTIKITGINASGNPATYSFTNTNGDFSITAANVATALGLGVAAYKGVDSTIPSSGDGTNLPNSGAVRSAINNLGATLTDEISNVRAVAEGKTKTYVISDATQTGFVNANFNSSANDVSLAQTAKIKTTDNTEVTLSSLKLGDIILVKETDVPDRFVSSTGTSVVFSKMETTKVDLSGYVNTLSGTANSGVVTNLSKNGSTLTVTSKSLATSDPTASGNSTTFIATISQAADGKITATKKTVSFPTDHNQTIKSEGTAFGADAAVNLVGGSNITLTPNTTSNTLEFSADNQTLYTDDSSFGADAAIKLTAGNNVTITGNATNGTITVSAKDTVYTLPTATTSALGGVKAAGTRSSAITTSQGGTTSGRYYGVEVDSNGKAFVNVPWTNVNSGYVDLTTNQTIGGSKLFTSSVTVSAGGSNIAMSAFKSGDSYFDGFFHAGSLYTNYLPNKTGVLLIADNMTASNGLKITKNNDLGTVDYGIDTTANFIINCGTASVNVF